MRKKSQVAGSLPPKIHADLICGLTEEQQRLYDQLLEQVIDDGFGSGAQRQTKVLAAITALKQVCNHPGLINGDLGELSGRSGKLDLGTDIVANNLEIGAPTLNGYAAFGPSSPTSCIARSPTRATRLHRHSSASNAPAQPTLHDVSTCWPPTTKWHDASMTILELLSMSKGSSAPHRAVLTFPPQ
ncbi:SNF2-related protein [Streptomyces decoyicus]|uniref:SNF2-related protein n=1 Tax=Streptomyces decoyicus TaxID=249567 RepID=UPI00339DE7B7